MISKYLAELIIEYGKDLFLYLTLVSEAIILEVDFIKASKNKYNLSELEDLRSSGFLDIKHSEDGTIEILLKKDGKWLAEPVQPRVFKKEPKEEFVPRQLQFLADLFGHPPDFDNVPKYRAMYSNILKKFDEDRLDCIANFIVTNKHQIDLNGFLTLQKLKYFAYMMDHPKKTTTIDKYADRCDIANYDDSETFGGGF